ncbi:MAG: 2-C-methyl-D-erythritol 4-phosphate cytidylyltransferase [Terrimicrobiaceae bacterium]|nr:2-C-methyl-D-erythritol 4-phosphate cytidylyltransferase [Terrimicrobiaceae bacterium]
MAGADDAAPLSAVIVAAGSSRRMGFDKILTPLGGEPLIRHTVRAFEQCAAVRGIVIVCARDRDADVRAALADARKIAAIVPGGEARQESVWNGLEALADSSAEFVAVHDAARPLVTPALIARCLDAAIAHGAAAAAEPATDTLQRADEAGCCAGVVEREGLWRMQTPQIFRLAELRRAMEAVRTAGVNVTDETSALRRLGGGVFLVENSDWNFKVTFPRDVAVAEFILQSRAAASLT